MADSESSGDHCPGAISLLQEATRLIGEHSEHTSTASVLSSDTNQNAISQGQLRQ